MLKDALRPGGRSARVQQSVHRAVQSLLARHGRDGLSVPLVAAEAGVTPSTIYRRWGDLATLLADVAVQRLRPDTEPLDTGSLRGDLLAWTEQYLDEMSSAPGRTMMRDVLAARDGSMPACQCGALLRAQLAPILERAARRGEAAPELEHLLDVLVAPIVFRLLYDETPPLASFARQRVDRALGGLST